MTLLFEYTIYELLKLILPATNFTQFALLPSQFSRWSVFNEAKGSTYENLSFSPTLTVLNLQKIRNLRFVVI